MRGLLLTAVGLAFAASALGDVSDISDSPGTTPDGSAAAIPIFRSFTSQVGTNVLSLGVGFGSSSGVFWVSDGGPSSSSTTDNVLVLFAPDGTFLASFPQPATDGFGWRDPAYTGDHFLFGSQSNVFHVNEGTLAVDNTFTVPGGPTLNRGIAIVSRTPTSLTCKSSTFGSPHFSWNWTIGGGPATVTGSCTVTETAIYGLAYDSGRNSIWGTTAAGGGGSGNLHEYDPVTCAPKAGSPFNEGPEILLFGGGEVADPGDGCRLWVVEQGTTDEVHGLQTTGSANPWGCAGTTAVETTSWGALKARYGN